MLFVKKRLYLTYQKSSISFFSHSLKYAFYMICTLPLLALNQGHTTVICSKKQILPRIFYSLRTAKNFCIRSIRVKFSKLV